MSSRSTRSRAPAQTSTKDHATPSRSSKAEVQQLSSPPATPLPSRNRRVASAATSKPVIKIEPEGKQTETPPAAAKRSAKTKVKVEDDDLPHNLGPIKSEDAPQSSITPAKKKRRVASKKDADSSPAAIKDENLKAKAAKLADAASTESSTRTPKKGKSKEKGNSYGLTPGQTPYPEWPHPTHEECHEVVRLLSKVHGQVKAPKSIPTPSLTVSGCGEVPSVLDALIRTRLSAATSNTNSSRAFQGLVKRFGVLEFGVGKGSVNWDAVRRADVKDIFEAIKSGGLADVKSKDIKKILQMVYEENQARRAALVSSADTEKKAPGAENESVEEKKEEIARAEDDVISLDHLHLLSNDEAFNALTKFPGIGPKTASCVLLFCMQRPSFAVDTHVFRLCKWLGWVPPDKATRNSTYAHCEVRIPDELKYALHYLFIKHGRTCGRCRAITGEGSADWSKGCPIEHLVTRSGVRKGGEGASPAKKRKKGALDEASESSEATDTDEDSDAGEAENSTPKSKKVTRKQPARSSARKARRAKVVDDDESRDSTEEDTDDYEE